MPYTNNQGVRIYYEVEGEGPPFVLQHPATCYLENWRNLGYTEALKDLYQLVLIDARGHGSSDKSHNPEAYRMPLMVSDVVAVLDDLSIEKAHYWGYSMGGMMGWRAAKYAPQLLRSAILGGALPYGEPDRPLTPEEATQIREEWEAVVAPPGRELAFRRYDDNEAPVAWAICNASPLRVYHPNALKEVLPYLAMPYPSLIYVGEVEIDDKRDRRGLDDNYLNCVKNIPNVTFVRLPGLGHLDAWYSADLVLPHVRRFLAEVGEE